MTYDWQFGFLWEYRYLILKGVAVTVAFAVGTTMLGLALGILVGLGRLLGGAWLRLPLTGFVEVFRCTPLLVQLVWLYYALPVVSGIQISAYMAATLALTFYVSSFYAEIFRGGVASIDAGQWDGARAIGMRRLQILRRVILPQAFRNMLPAIMNQAVIQLKNTSLVSTVAVADLLYQGSIITAATYRPLEVYTLVAVLYFAVLFPMTRLSSLLERRLER
ncbi:MAG: amino acid ABC transporter permease [Variovorax sp.]